MATRDGGGISNYGTITVDNGGVVTTNTANWRGGGIYNEGGTVTNNGKISHNSVISVSRQEYSGGGGIYSSDGRSGEARLNNGGEVSGNSSATYGGGVLYWGNTSFHSAGTIRANSANTCNNVAECIDLKETDDTGTIHRWICDCPLNIDAL